MTLDQGRLSVLGAFDKTRVQKRRKLITKAVSELATIFFDVSFFSAPSFCSIIDYRGRHTIENQFELNVVLRSF